MSISRHSIQLGVRFIQGYRYLDRCGEAMIRLENSLDAHWITAETSPTSGTMKNEILGMTLAFNSDGMNIHQAEYDDVNAFRDQACKAYGILTREFGIGRINAPALRAQLQYGYENEQAVDDANQRLMETGFVQMNSDILRIMQGKAGALDFTVVTEGEKPLPDERTKFRRRLQASVVRQEKATSLDQRILRRTTLLPTNQREAFAAVLRMRRTHPMARYPVAIQFDLENTYESEFAVASFNMPDFIDDSFGWTEQVREFLSPRVGLTHVPGSRANGGVRGHRDRGRRKLG